ncbi:MAG: hypothetical protein LBG91_02230 [Treponema sp.]|jgi:hypothetical protein|nr:hypothetical protein [Treponema sp.]
MARKYGYVDPLLSNLAVDYSQKVREGLVGPIVFPRVPVPKPSGKYAEFDKEAAFKVPDTTMAGERSQANEFHASAKKHSYATTPYGLKAFIDNADLEFMDGPFKVWEKRKAELLVSKLELAQEKRIADKILNLSGRSTSLAGTGSGKGKKWSNNGGDPFYDIKDAIEKLFFRPNVMLFNEAIFDVLEYHPILIAKLGNAGLLKKVDEATLAKLFRIDRVIIAKGRADFGKRNSEGGVEPKDIWGDAVILAHTSDQWDQPCAGKTFSLQYKEADSEGYVVRTWDEEDGGMLGGEYVQAAHETDEVVVCKDLVYTIKEVL